MFKKRRGKTQVDEKEEQIRTKVVLKGKVEFRIISQIDDDVLGHGSIQSSQASMQFTITNPQKMILPEIEINTLEVFHHTFKRHKMNIITTNK